MTAKRKPPTLTEEPSDLVGNAYALILQETIKAVWDNIGGELTSVGGTANAITASLLIGTDFDGFKPGMRFSFTPTNTNTGTTQITINGYTAYIKREGGANLSAGDLTASWKAWLEYDSDMGALILQRGASAQSLFSISPYSFLEEIDTSGNWVAPWKCRARIWLIGPGGTGGVLSNNNGNNRCSGGGAGALCMKDNAPLNASEQLAFVLAAAGSLTGVSNSAGDDGGDSTCTGPNSLSMVAGGGKGGERSTTTTANGGNGGTASGGDLNVSGQNGTDANGSNVEACGGHIGLNSQPAELALNTTTPGNAFDSLNVVARYGPFTHDSNLIGGATSGSSTATPGTAPGYGGGSGGNVYSVNTTINAGDGGASIAVVEFTGDLS